MPDRKRGNPDGERAARMDILLEELRLNTEDLRELARQATERARESRGMAHDKLKVIREPRTKRGRR
jgi:hypothetical protein